MSGAHVPGVPDQKGADRKVIAKKQGVRSTPVISLSKQANHNADICEMLAEIGVYETIGGDKTKGKVYERAVQTLKHHHKRVESGGEAMKLSGIGKKIAAKIDEAITTGTIKKLEKLQADPELQAMRLFQGISGVGPAAAKKWVREEKLTTIEELRESSVSLNHHQKVGLKHYEDFASRIPRDEVTALGEVVAETAREIDGQLVSVVAGSYRRGRPDSGDIDVLLSHPEFRLSGSRKQHYAGMLKALIDRLTASAFLTDHLVNGVNKYNGVCRLPDGHSGERKYRRIDILLLPWDEWACGILYFTGSGFFNVQMRTIALERGFTLNERNIRPIGVTGVIGQPIAVSSEEDIFTVLDMEYKTPQERDL